MSLIRVRRERKKDWIDTRKGLSPGKMVMLLVVVAVMIWFLSNRF
jgi:hypothetical protein